MSFSRIAALEGRGTIVGSLLLCVAIGWVLTRKKVKEAAEDVTEDATQDSGWRLDLDRDYEVKPTARTCGNCQTTLPLECFCELPCCYHTLCQMCARRNTEFCGECLTPLCRKDNENGILWLLDREDHVRDPFQNAAILGRAFIMGSGVFLDEVICTPYFDRLVPPDTLFAILRAPNVLPGIQQLSIAAENGVISAQLHLAEVFSSNFKGCGFEKDKEKAEYWHRRAIGCENEISPIAVARYGLFLKWEGRAEEARNMFSLAAETNHSVAQYEMALLSLDDARVESQQENMSKAIEWLCRSSASKYLPSYLLLAKTLIEVTESAYGDIRQTGISPLPRVLQILLLLTDEQTRGLGLTVDIERQATTLIERYGSNDSCFNCGQSGSECAPLVECQGCFSVKYCSRLCQRQNFRDGHKFDCCSTKNLFDFHLVKTTLPWNADMRIDRKAIPAFAGNGSRGRSLMHMVEDDTDEVYGENDINYGEDILARLMVHMRQNLESYLGEVLELKESEKKQMSLEKRIKVFKGRYKDEKEFVDAMNKIRIVGNKAAHYQRSEAFPVSLSECEEAVAKYRLCKGMFVPKRPVS